MGCRCHDEPQDKPKAPITGPAQAECIYGRQINSLAASSTDDAKRISELSENLSVAGCFIAAMFVFYCASLVAACAEVNRVRSEIKQLELDRDLLRMTVYGTNEAVSKELRRINQHTGMSRFEWNAGGAE